MDNLTKQQMVFEANRKSAGVAYLLWFFFGGFGVHRFYLDQKGTGITQLLLLLLGWLPFFMGWVVLGIWLFVDLFLIPGLTSEFNMDLIRSLDDVRTRREGLTGEGPVPASRLDFERR